MDAGIAKANNDPNVKALVICGKGKFLAGADIKEFETGVGRNSKS